MKKLVMILLIISTFAVFGQYSVGEIVVPADNFSWTISGPAGHDEIGNSSNIFDMIASGKPVMISFGQFG